LASDPPTAIQIALLDRLEGGSMLTTVNNNATFDLGAFLAHAGLGRRIVEVKEKANLYSQGNPADSVFYVQRGRVKLTVVSQTGKEATITLHSQRILKLIKRFRRQ
jgi:CRP-like cAMP-binding protein